MHFYCNQQSLALLSLGLMANALYAQSVPDAGSLRQQIEQQRNPVTPQPNPTRRAALLPETKPIDGMTVTVKSFAFSGNQLLSQAQLDAALAAFLNRPLSFGDLQRAADTVTAAYREAGWMARVSLPQQDISEGRVSLQIFEARYGGYRFEGSPSQRVKREDLERFFAARLERGQALNANALDRALLLADDLPGVSVAGTLVAGQNEGETALVLQTTDEPFVFGDAGIDNHGARSTGNQRVTANMNINSPMGQGDSMGVNLLHSKGSDYGRLAWTVPVGQNGLRVGVNLSSMNYKVIDGPSANSEAPIRGKSGSKGLDMNYPLLRSRISNVYLNAGLENKDFLTQDVKVSADYESASWRVGLSGNHFDELGGGGANSAFVQLTEGRLRNMHAHFQIDTIDRRYRKLNYSFSRQQTLSNDHSLFVSLNGQHATQVLDSSERFFVGGAQSVRAYPSSELGGDRGQVINAEWRWRLDRAWVVTAFADVGRTTNLPALSGVSAKSAQLRGQGLSLAWQGPKGLQSKLTWAQRNGNNPNPSSTGTDSDGTLKLNRIWFSTSLPF
jgi:hemolysin activation/secretion protein